MGVEDSRKRSTQEEAAASLYLEILTKVMKGLVDSARVQRYRSELEPLTQLTKSVLLARAYRDLQDPQGKLIVTTAEGSKQDDFAMFGKFRLEGQDPSGEHLVFDKPVIGVVLNANALCFRRGKLDFDLSSEDFFQVLDATVQALVAIEQEGEQVMTRDEYVVARERILTPPQ
ncbi:MAG: hypothetical protein A2785_04200 [Candidatus Chisholmbacteria bacterium RIFCSPHIGHO2_01_FULL_49_18]|uniref:Uncharacterized protein n=2 Tax=Candidatus Chisholmiibacteriota TaxID=1817900 RepID=A0A1G1VP80_9BACT|nr:MAG: hypothetical protein A2785_04200 [Candidatus Chisholmbacteria bacterium RIFCSPHIGHO2_01_FULL_49_18]OGY22526.1 MAG: hypothetical protein A3A65_00865 [Candidatus Chisholmbacteria bacterium RIFCSPLOWO2_01_FULL_49_14]